MTDEKAIIFKICSTALWQEAVAQGRFTGAPIDLADGYIHFSTAETVRETARLHFAGQEDLLLVALDSAAFGDALVYERSRGGQLFPHLYGTFDPATALWVKPLERAADGTFDFPEEVPAS